MTKIEKRDFLVEEDIPMLTEAMRVSTATTNENFVWEVLVELMMFTRYYGDGSWLMNQASIDRAGAWAKARLEAIGVE